MQIMICDDENQELEKINRIVCEYADSHPEFLLKIKAFKNPFDMLGYVSKYGSPDILLLDICMPGISGTEAAKETLNTDKNSTDIIFLTTSSDYAVEAFTLHASDYIKKPYTKKQLLDSLDRIIQSRQIYKYALIKCEKDIYRINLYDLVYAETKHSILEIHLKTGILLKTRMTLTKFKDLFEGTDGFSLVGASYFINFRCVQVVCKELLKMSNGDSLTIPRRLKNDLKIQLFEFYKNEAIGYKKQ